MIADSRSIYTDNAIKVLKVKEQGTLSSGKEGLEQPVFREGHIGQSHSQGPLNVDHTLQLTFRVDISHRGGRPLAEVAYESIKSEIVAQRVPCQVLEDVAEPPIRHYRDSLSSILAIPCEVAITLIDQWQTLDFDDALTLPGEVSKIVIFKITRCLKLFFYKMRKLKIDFYA